MTTLQNSLRGLTRALFSADSSGRVVMLISAQRGEGVSPLARTLAELACARAERAVVLTDLDVQRDSQFDAFCEQARSGGAGIGAGVPGALAGRCFFGPKEAVEAFTMHRIGRSKLLVTHFDAKRARPNVRVRILDEPGYWQAARRACNVMLVDAPALARSRIGLVIARHVDAVVIVASGRTGSASATLELKAELQARAAPILGVIYADADPGVLAIERALKDV